MRSLADIIPLRDRQPRDTDADALVADGSAWRARRRRQDDEGTIPDPLTARSEAAVVRALQRINQTLILLAAAMAITGLAVALGWP